MCDDALVPVPPGVPGELLVGGVPLAQGYVNPSPKDAARFTVLPWLDGERFYRTGDYALWLPDGSLAFLGRRDDQVKIRGYRVVLRSVEAALRALPEIRDAVLVADRQAQGGGDLVAYVIPQDGAELSPKGLRAGLGAVLPEPMIPSQFIPVSRFPLTANGKIDRTALAAHRRPRRGTDAGERGSAVEETLRQIWQSVLFQESIGLDDDFFELGGHSIKAILILSKVRSTLKQRLAIRDLFDNPTIRRLARRLAEPAESGAEPPPSPLLTLRTGSPSAIPAFFLPPTLGTATPYKEVVDRLSGDLACYGLQCRGFDRDEPPDRDFAAMAAGFAKRIRAALPAGPYRLVGWSMGAYLALETARLLERDGAAVRLVLLDAAPKLGDGRDDPEPPPIDGFATLRREPYWNRVLDIMTRHLPPSDLARIERLAVHNHHLTVAYSFTGQLQADIACIEGAANQRPARMERLVAATSGRVTVHHVPGNHYTMFQPPNLEVVATFLSAALAAP